MENELQVIIPLHLGTQGSLITIAIFTTHLSIDEWRDWGVAISFGIMFLLSLFSANCFHGSSPSTSPS